MGLKKIVKKLGHLLDENIEQELENCEEIKELLEKLEKKQKKLEMALNDKDGAKKPKKIKLELKIIKAQLKKGYKIFYRYCL